MGTPNLIAPASVKPTNLAGDVLGSGYGAVITCGGGQAVKIGSAVICNNTGAAVNVSIAIVPNSETPSDALAVLFNYPLSAGDSFPLWDYLGDQWLAEGDSVCAKAGTAGAVVFSATGLVYT